VFVFVYPQCFLTFWNKPFLSGVEIKENSFCLFRKSRAKDYLFEPFLDIGDKTFQCRDYHMVLDSGLEPF
ncbi:hypothetical protein, partial [Acinetobacter baumannii]|uniref:hypothetical protein n=1 Tax=Acinetobacter baumannii TaxID=470 RepID=UPI001BB46268